MLQNSQWIEKYKPKKISDIVCNKTAVSNIQAWLSNWNKIKTQIGAGKKEDSKKKAATETVQNKKSKVGNSCMIVTGNHGVGKSVVVDVIMRENGYDLIQLNFETLDLEKNIRYAIKKLVKSSNIYDMMCDEKKKKVAIVIDEIESITSSNDKKLLSTLQKMNDHEWLCPVIFISNNQHNKLLSEIKKNSFEVKLWPPFDTDMKRILRVIAMNEGINIKSEKVIDKIIDHSQGDIRRLIYTLQDIFGTFGKQLITDQVIEKYCEFSNRKDVDIDLYKATNTILYHYKDINNCLRYYETEKVLLPLMVHQNYAASVLLNINSSKDQYEIIKKVGESLSTGDVVENYIYGDQSWEMQEIHGFHTCAATSFYLCEKMTGALEVDLAFTTDLNKTSIKKINKKNINNTNRCFKNMNIFDYIYVNKIIRKLIDSNRIQECVNLMKNYGIRLEHIESLLKIDKIKNAKTALTSKQKKEFNKYLGEFGENI
jgi:DNA polymerase III delta prime subunit